MMTMTGSRRNEFMLHEITEESKNNDDRKALMEVGLWHLHNYTYIIT